MKHHSRLLAAVVLAGVCTSLFAATSVKATVNGMDCELCAQDIQKRLSKLPATKAVFVDLKRRLVAVETREGQRLDGPEFTAQMTQAGYEVVKFEPSVKSIAEIKAELRTRK